MVNNTNQTSFHFAVDDTEAWQGLLLTRNGWHAGDGSTGAGNRKHIGVEICYSKSGGVRFDKAEDNAAELIASLLKQYGFGIDRVRKHQDFSGKYCPHRTLDRGWNRFLDKVKAKMEGVPTMPDTTLYTYLGVSNDAEAKTRLEVHLGEKDSKCDWGSEEENRGGFLGSARRDTKRLQSEVDKLTSDINALNQQVSGFPAQLESAKNAGYEEGFAAGQATNPTEPVDPSEPNLDNWEMNTLTIETVRDNRTTIVHYTKKE